MPLRRYSTARSLLQKAALRAATHCYLGKPMLMSSVIWASCSWLVCSFFSSGFFSQGFFSSPSIFSSFFSSFLTYFFSSSFFSSFGLGTGLATWFMQTTKSVSLMPIFSTESSPLRVLPLKTTLRVSADIPLTSWILALRTVTCVNGYLLCQWARAPPETPIPSGFSRSASSQLKYYSNQYKTLSQSHITTIPMPTFIAPLAPPLLLLAAVNLLPLLYPPPVLVQLLLNAILSIHIGTLFSSSLAKASYQQVQQGEEQLRSGTSSHFSWKHCWQIAQYPLMGCAVLLGLYFSITYADQLTVKNVLDFAFIILCTYYGGSKLNLLSRELLIYMKERWEVNDHILNLFEKISMYIFCPLLALLFSLLYVVSKYWLLNNLFALFFTITAIKYAGVKTFKVAVPILWSLFAYDMYWVYRSDVMVTVAKGIDLPLKLQFPYRNFVGDVEFSILGLGDIIIPGLFLSLCFKYDVDNSILSASRQRVKHFKTPLYYTALGMYFIGLLMTYSALFFFERPQPALVFIVPCLTMSLAANRCFERRLPLCKYHSSAMAKSQQNLERV